MSIVKFFYCAGQQNNKRLCGRKKTKKKQLKLLQLWNGIIQVLTWNPLRGLCQDSGKQCLLTNWLNRDQGTCHIENLRQAPFGGSQGQTFCIEKRKHMPKFPFNHIAHAENTTYFGRTGFGSDAKNETYLLVAPFQVYSSVHFLSTPNSIHYDLTALCSKLCFIKYLLSVTYFSASVPRWVQCILYVFPNCNYMAKYKHKMKAVMAILHDHKS